MENNWWPPEMYFEHYGGLNFTHGNCKDCFGKFAA